MTASSDSSHSPVSFGSMSGSWVGRPSLMIEKRSRPEATLVLNFDLGAPFGRPVLWVARRRRAAPASAVSPGDRGTPGSAAEVSHSSFHRLLREGAASSLLGSNECESGHIGARTGARAALESDHRTVTHPIRRTALARPDTLPVPHSGLPCPPNPATGRSTGWQSRHFEVECKAVRNGGVTG